MPLQIFFRIKNKASTTYDKNVAGLGWLHFFFVYNEELTTCEQGEDLMNHKST